MKKNKFVPKGQNIDRKAATREQKNGKEELPKLCFNQKDFQKNQIPPGQTYKEWENEERLSDLFNKMEALNGYNITEAQQKGMIKIYGNFPEHSEFKNPFPDSDLKWAVIMDVGGQKARVAGYILDHIFYIVFLDADHLFYPTTKK